ncbi:hypothetical protein BJV77DRAFT_165617 [Russula vinacea]|nr:hypothetical protein BJV77DRAFT_165617 [Russula vinacea]
MSLPPVVPPLNFQSTFRNALCAYKKRTGQDLLLHPLAARLQSCNSPDAIISVLQEQAQAVDQFCSGDEKLSTSFGRTIGVLYFLSSNVGDVGLVSSPAKVIFVGISVLLSVAHTVHASQDGLIDVFRRMDKFFERLHTYTMIPPPQSSRDLNEQIMLTVLSILTIVTEEIAQGRTKVAREKCR